eukprot:TRINITY_DN1980_c0_g1_i6.p1 TRINITY_DN1980_c0_g1~~TRINITY_DN1980_c0_g1_i6.p1  ORF type:complete len:403 (+),score=11.29 TRINITY_DN1980_c0_g1_i6:147-1355(+)
MALFSSRFGSVAVILLGVIIINALLLYYHVPITHYTSYVSSNLRKIALRRRHAIPCTPREPSLFPNSTVILYYTPYYKERTSYDIHRPIDCPDSCRWTSDLAYQSHADGLIFHASDWNWRDVPPHVCGQKWVMYTQESPLSLGKHGEGPTDEELQQDFDLVSTYRLDSDIPRPYFPYDSGPGRLFDPPVPTSQRQKAPVMWVASNCEANNRRLDYVKELMKYIEIDSYGSCLKNKEWPRNASWVKGKSGDFSRKNFYGEELFQLTRQYKFYLAFANSNCVDYVDEKVWRSLEAGAVPIVLGAPNLRDFSPLPGAIIETADFRSPKHLAEYLHTLNANSTLYEYHLRFKSLRQASPHFSALWMKRRSNWECRVCQAVRRAGNTHDRVKLSDHSCADPTTAGSW